MANVEGATNGGSAGHNGSGGAAATTGQRLDYQGNLIPGNYKWIALSNTTLGVLIATINAASAAGRSTASLPCVISAATS